MRCEFDRGTVALRDLDAALAHELESVAWDGRVGAHRVSSAGWREVARALEQAGIRAEVDDDLRPGGLAGVRVPELRAHQRLAVDEWHAAGA